MLADIVGVVLFQVVAPKVGIVPNLFIYFREAYNYSYQIYFLFFGDCRAYKLVVRQVEKYNLQLRII